MLYCKQEKKPAGYKRRKGREMNWEIGHYEDDWCQMPDDAGEGQFLMGRIVRAPEGIAIPGTVTVRSAYTGRLWNLFLDDEGRVIECDESDGIGIDR